MAGIKDLIENPHPIYSNNIAYWNFLLNSYEGGADYTNGDLSRATSVNKTITVKVNGKVLEDKRSGNLFMHKKERVDDYIERIDMSYYYNFCAPIIDIYTNHLFKIPVTTEWGNIESAIDVRLDNIDRKGSSLVEFRKEMAELSQIYGHVFVLTDKPKTEVDIASLEQQQELGLFPYMCFFRPQDLLNWALDQFGQAHWVLLRETHNGNIDPFMFDKDNMSVVQYRIWTREEWILFNDKFAEIDRGTHGLGKVPLDIVYNKPSKKYKNYLGISEIADISYIARDVYNKCSELNEIIRNQTFAVLCLQGKSTDYDELTVGTSKALLYPIETNTPSYVSPPAENAKILMEQIDRQVRKMYQLAKLEGGSASQINQVKGQSGIAKAFDFQETNSALAKKASHMEDAEMRIFDTWAKWEGKGEFDGSIQYPREFNVQELMQDLEESEKLMKMNLGATFNEKMNEEIIKKKYPSASKEDIDIMVEEANAGTEVKTEGSSLRDRLPFVFNTNATQGGKNRENEQ